jgi:UDP:flavonoid glycosyltransferase YjiC (YdhE family)
VAKVLCAWEFGADLGHVRRLIPIARELRAMGHSAAFAFRDSAHLATASAEGFEVFAAPLLRPPLHVSPSPLSHSDILLNLGFADRPGLAGALRAWRSLYELVRPDILVADYAPTALVAARAAGLRRVTIGTGFAQPADGDPLPALRPWAPLEENVLRGFDERVLTAIRAASNGAASSVPREAREIFAAQAHLLCTFPELDPFGPRADVEYAGPQGDATTGANVRWKSTAGPRVFAYLKPRDPRFAAVLQGLRTASAEVIVAAPGLDAGEARAASSETFRVVPGTVNLDPMLGEASLCVSHAGPGLAARALVAGVPMALLPLQLEQFLVAVRLRDGGSAQLVSPEEAAPDFREWFGELLARDDLREAARRHAGTHRGYSFGDATRRAAERIVQVATAAA